VANPTYVLLNDELASTKKEDKSTCPCLCWYCRWSLVADPLQQWVW